MVLATAEAEVFLMVLQTFLAPSTLVPRIALRMGHESRVPLK